MSNVVIVDYGLSNLLSVERAVQVCGSTATVSSDAALIARAEKLILPGVGAFEDGMQGLRRLGLAEALQSRAAAGVPLLGICLGMQMLFTESDEFGLHRGLDLIPGRVERLPDTDVEGRRQRVPQVGWNRLIPALGLDSFEDSILAGLTPAAETYFVHSYEAKPAFAAHRLADTLYGGRRVCAACRKDTVWGTQFHPEKSGPVGLHILQNFLSL